MIDRIAWGVYLRTRVRDNLKHLEQYGSMSPATQNSHLFQVLRNLLQHHGASEYGIDPWRRASSISLISEFREAWLNLPITTKRDLRENFRPERILNSGRSGRVLSTGGSTGEPTQFLHDRSLARAASACRTYSRLRQGWSPGVPTVAIWGSERDIGRQRKLRHKALSWARNEHLIDGYTLGSKTITRLLELATRFDRIALYGFTSMLDYVARELLSQGDTRLHGRVVTAWNGGETLTPDQAERFEQAFGTPLLNLYGGRELSALAFQPQRHSSLFALSPLIVLEVVDDSGHPVPPGQSGRILCTSTASLATPFIRYEIGDIGIPDEHSSFIGVNRLAQVSGRITDTIELPTGEQLHGLFWNHLAKEYPSISAFQVRHSPTSISFLFEGYLDEHQLADLSARGARTCGGLEFSVINVHRLPRTEQGKLLQVVREEVPMSLKDYAKP